MVVLISTILAVPTVISLFKAAVIVDVRHVQERRIYVSLNQVLDIRLEAMFAHLEAPVLSSSLLLQETSPR